MKHLILVLTAAILFTTFDAPAQVPQLVNYQGRIQVGTENFDGMGQFKFALVNPGNGFVFWTNDGTGINDGSEPLTAVPVRVTKGLYSVLLGDATLENMRILTSAAFASGDVYLRIWFNDGTTGFQRLRPDQRFAAVGYAMIAGSVLDGSITTAKLAPASVKAPQLDASAVTTDKLASAAVTAEKMGPASILTSHVADGSITAPKLAIGSVEPDKIDDRYSLWNKGGSVLSYSAGKVGIGTVTPDAPFEVVSGDQTVTRLHGSSSGGTWLGLRNSSPGGNEWSLISSGSGNGEGPGKLLFFNGGLKMQLDAGGNLNVAGNINAANFSTPLIQFSQGSESIFFQDTNPGDVKNIDEISMAIPAVGYVQITALVDVYFSTTTTPVGDQWGEFAFILYDTTPSSSGESQQRELTRVSSIVFIQLSATAITRRPIQLSWVLPVDGPKTISLRTQGAFEDGGAVTTYAHNLTAVFIAARAAGTSSHSNP